MKIDHAFLQDAGARGIIAALGAAGEETRFVGGCVRDGILGISGSDIDLATTALPEKTMTALEVVGFTVKPLGSAHGVIFAWRDGRKYEIATLREDVQTDGRHAIVAYTRDWTLDAQRRDFTINALSADADGTVHDYTGGMADIAARRVRFIGDASTRIREDYLRILRFYRFHARFGAEWDANARAACRAQRASLSQLSRERVTDELAKLLSLKNPIGACRAMTEDRIFEATMPELNNIAVLEKLLAREKTYGTQSWPVRLSAWAGGAATEKFLDYFIFPRTARADLQKIATLDFHEKLNHAIYHFGKDTVRSAVLLRADDAALPRLMQQIENFTLQDFPLQAEDILQMGISPGPRLGEILRNTENWWLENNCVADHAACKSYAATLATVSKE